MKTKNLHIARNLFLVVLFTGFAIASTAQTRTRQSGTTYSRNSSRNSTATRAKVATRSSQPTVTSRTKNSAANSRITYQPRNESSKPATSYSQNGNKNNGHNGNYSKGHNGNNNYGYNNKSHGNSWNHGYKSYGKNHNWDHRYYSAHHPRTYNVWNFPAPWRYSAHGLVFRYAYGDYFFSNNRFYRYDPYRGYYTVNYPTEVYFDYLPIGYNEVMIDGRIYFRYGDVYFVATPAGYRLARPNGIYLSFQF